MADWLAGVDLLDPEAVAAAARPVMAAMTNPNGLDRAAAVSFQWELATWHDDEIQAMDGDDWQAMISRTFDALEAVGLDLMDGRDWRKSAGVE